MTESDFDLVRRDIKSWNRRFKTGIPSAARIEEQPPALFEPAEFLRKTAGEEAFAVLRETLQQIRAVNTEFLGEKTEEVNVFLEMTDRVAPIRDGLIEWFDRYFDKRIEKGYVKEPRGVNRLLAQYFGLLKEAAEILDSLLEPTNCVAFAFLHVVDRYIQRSLFERVLLIDLRTCGTSIGPPENWDSHNEGLLLDVLNGLGQQNLALPVLSMFMTRACDAISDEELDAFAAEPVDDLEDYLAELAAEIQAMRPLLMRNFNPAKSIVTLSEDCHLLWDWKSREAIASIKIAQSAEDPVVFDQTMRMKLVAFVGRDGRMNEFDMPWKSLRTVDDLAYEKSLALNTLILERFRNRLAEHFAKIDLEQIRQAANAGVDDDTQFDEIVTAIAQQPGIGEEETVGEFAARRASRRASPQSRIRSLKMNRLLNLLEREFGCEVQKGSGSEVTVFRVGGKKKIISKHKANRTIEPLELRHVLKRVGIGLEEWCAAVGG